MSTVEDSQNQKQPLRVQLTDVTVNNLGQVKLLVQKVLPVEYSDQFYQACVANWPRENPCVRLAYHNEYLVGTIICRRESFIPSNPYERVSVLPAAEVIPTPKERARKPVKDADGNVLHFRVYIAIIAVLEAYRDGNVGSTLLKDIIDYADQHYDTLEEICLHVHVGNEKAVKFYESHGFSIVTTIDDYFKNGVVDPPHAHFMTRKSKAPISVKEFVEETPE